MMNKDSKGITLIALIITIIVLLILAGVTISAITGNESAMEKAQEAAQKTKEAEQEEQIRLNEVSSKLEPEWDGTVATSFAGGDGTEEKPFRIENGSQLAYLAALVNGDITDLPSGVADKSFYGVNVSIVKSINLGNKEFTPISYGGNSATDGNGDVYIKGTIFQGTLDGNNNVITGLKIGNEDMQQRQGVGLVGVLGEYGTVKNVIVYEGKVNAACMVGGIVGASRGTVSNCINSAQIMAVESNRDSGNIAGGIVGYSDGGVKIINCKNHGSVTSEFSNLAGGILGWCQTGEVEITNCSNSGTITANRQSAGGIAGRITAGSITNCYNTGNIDAKSVGGKGVSGGIVGGMINGTISDVYNSGIVKVGNCEDLSKIDTAGGIVGVQQNGSILNAYNKGELIKAQDEITTGEALDVLGGVVGEKTEGSVDKTFYYTTDSNLAGIGGLNASQTGTKKATTDINSLKEFLSKINSL